MLDAETMQLGLVGLAAVSAAALIYFLAYPLLSGESKAEKRIQGVTENKAKRAVRTAQVEQASNRRRQVAETLKELEQKQKQREKLTMRMRLERAGLDITPRSFWIMSIVAGLVFGAITYVSLPGMNPLISVAAAFVGALGLPRWLVARLIKRRQTKFLDEFANSIDVAWRAPPHATGRGANGGGAGPQEIARAHRRAGRGRGPHRSGDNRPPAPPLRRDPRRVAGVRQAGR